MKNKQRKSTQSQVHRMGPRLVVRIAHSARSSTKIVTGLSLLLLIATALPLSPAHALDIGYSGRLMEDSGKSIEGPLDFTVKFYNDPTIGDVVGPTLKFANTELRDGVFQLSISLDNSQMAALYGDGSKSVYIELEAGGKTYPRQRFTAVPLALRVPVDTNKLNYTNEGKLTIESVDLNQISGLSAALAAKADVTSVSASSVKISNNLSDLTSTQAARTNLGLGGLATLGSVSSTEITDGAITNADINASAAIATAKLSGAVTSITGHGLGGLATLGSVSSTEITDGAITNADINASAAIVDSKLATISTPGKVSGSAVTSGTIGGSTIFSSSGAITTSGTITGTGNVVVGGTGSAATELRFNDNDNSNYVSLKAPATVSSNVSFVLPVSDGTGGQLLRTDGSGNLSWISVGGGGDMLAGNNLSDLTNKPLARTTLGLGALATLGAVGSTEITNDSIVNADINASAAIATSKLSGSVTSITGHGLGGLATLSAVGSTEITDGSITDADINASAAIAQSKISGLSTSLSGKEPTITAGTTAQFYRGDKSWQTFDSTARAAFSITGPLTYNSGTGVFGLGQSSGVADGYLSSSDFTVFNNKQEAITAASTLNTGTLTSALQNGVQIKPYGVAAGNAGELRFNELAAGGTNYVGFKAPDTLAGDKIWTLPAADGTSGQVLKTDGSGILSWVSVGMGNMLGSNNLSDITVPATARTNLGLGGLATLGVVGSTEITDGSILNADVNASAAIATSKLSGAVTSITGHGLGSLATLSAVGSSEITNDAIVNADINASAAIATTKLSGAVTSITGHGLGSLATLSAVGSTQITDDSIVDADINASAAIADTKLATITTAGKVSGSAITSGTIGGSTVVATSGQLSSTGNIRVAGTGVTATDLRFGDNDDSHYVGFKAPATVTTDRIWTLPAADGSNGQILRTNGSGVLSWVSAGGGGDMLAANNLSDVASAATARTNLGLGALATLGVVGSTEITDGSILNADVNASAAIATSKLSGAVTSITGHGLGSLATLSAVGSTEISNDSIVDADINASAAIAQSKISGLSTSLSGKEPTITAGTTTQYYRGDKSWQTFDSTARAAFSITAPLTYNSGTGVFGLGQSSGVADGYLSSSDFTVFNNKQAVITAASTLNTGTLTSALQNGVQIKPYGVAAGNAGELRFNELAAGGTNYVGFKAPDTLAGDKIWTLPDADGTSGQVLKTDGSGILGWISVGTGNMLGSNNLSDITVPATARTNLGLGALATLGAVGSTEITDGSLVNADINASAAIATSKLSGAVTSITGHGLGSLAALSAVGSTEVTNDSIVNADINASAAIATSKLSGAVTSITGHGLGSLATLSAVGSTEITNDSIVDADINASAAIADSKLATISTAGKVSGSAITSGTIAGSTIFNSTGAITTTGTVTATGNYVVYGTGAASTELRFNDNDNTNYVGLKAPATVTTNKIWTLPAADGTSGQVLSTDGSGTLSWAASGGGGGLTSCPSGFTMIGTSGKRGTFCIDTTERTAAAWLTAKVTCQNLSLTEGAAFMCDHNEWYKACNAGTPTGMTGNWEWVAEFYGYGNAIVAGSSSCESLNSYSMTNTNVFRCCVR